MWETPSLTRRFPRAVERRALLSAAFHSPSASIARSPLLIVHDGGDGWFWCENGRREPLRQPVLHSRGKTIEATDQDVAEVEGPSSLANREQTNLRAGQNLAGEYVRTVPLDLAVRTDRTHIHGRVVFEFAWA